MPRHRIPEMATAGRQTAAAGRASEAAQACIDAFFDGDSSVFSVEPVEPHELAAEADFVPDFDEAPESGTTGVIPLAPAA